VLIAHFLGVDHVGHTFGPNHYVMADKLRQMNEAVARIIALIDDETILFVLGDHGMTEDGNHGVC
jgi:phosphatidylinositol glycan class O